GIEAGIWIEQMITSTSLGGGTADPTMPMRMPGMPGTENTPAPQADASGQSITNIITLVCRAVDLAKNGGDASANIDMAHAVETEIKNCPMVTGASTSLVGNIVVDDSNGTVTFTLNVAPTAPPTFTPGNSSN
ncbi:MAG TPA: hypothetical protein VG347_17445, partial [Verrucomicrobiae bacterium]|nr:hypothetical protein [Verrucomicrobiae bacterium]